MKPQSSPSKLRGQDLAEMVVGSVVLAFPVAVTEEIWTLSTELSPWRVILICFSSLYSPTALNRPAISSCSGAVL